MKKLIAALLTGAFILLSFSGCVFDGKKTALVISGTEIDNEIYAYYLDMVEQRPGDYGLTESFSDSDAQDAAVKLCVRYLAFNTLFADKGLSLSNSDKLEIAENVNNFWIRSENHYNEIGVSRQTLNKILTSEAYEDAIFEALYDKGTDNADGEKTIKAYFYSNYTAFRNICAYFTGADGSSVTEQEKQDLITAFSNIAANSGTTSEEFGTACSDAGYAASDTVILERNSDGYPDGFFAKVYAMSSGTKSVITYDDCVFAVYKESLEELGDGVYSSYRSTCIENMYADDWQQFVDNYLAKFTVDEIKI